MITKTRTNGYEISNKMMNVLYSFEEAVDRVFGADTEETDVTIEHFYYGDKLDMLTVKVPGRGYGHYHLTERSVHFNGHTCLGDDYGKFASLAWNDDLFEEEYGNFWQYICNGECDTCKHRRTVPGTDARIDREPAYYCDREA